MKAHAPAEAERSFDRIDDRQLAKLCEIATQDSEEFFALHPKYRSTIICIALCQGAALHYVDRRNGVKDFDVWTFYKRTEAHLFPVRRRQARDFGRSKFGKNPDDAGFIGRRVDLLGRSIEEMQDPIASIQAYLRQAWTQTAIELSRKAVVLLYPAYVTGEVAWPISAVSKAKQ